MIPFRDLKTKLESKTMQDNDCDKTSSKIPGPKLVWVPKKT